MKRRSGRHQGRRCLAEEGPFRDTTADRPWYGGLWQGGGEARRLKKKDES